MPSTRIEIRDLVKSYPGSAGTPPTHAVDHVSLTIEPGELFFLLGPSGCGKTTLLRMIAGFVEPTSGSIHFENGGARTDVTRMPAEKRNTGMVFQSYALWPHMTVSKNVSFGLMMKKIIGPNIEKRAMDALERVQMAGYSDRKPTQLSGGQQQRVALARAMVIEPNVLLLDEPLSNLDAKLRVELRAEIKDVCKSTGMTAIYVTHDQAEALSMADRIAIMRSGRVIQTGTPRDLYESPRSAFVAHFLGDSNVLRGTVLQVGKVTCDVEVLGIQMCVSNDRVLGTISSGQPIELHCRPENVIVDGGGMQQSHLTIHAALEGVEYLGAHARCTYRVEIGTLISAMIPGHKFEIPTHAQLTIPGSQLSILPIEN